MFCMWENLHADNPVFTMLMPCNEFCQVFIVASGTPQRNSVSPTRVMQ